MDRLEQTLIDSLPSEHFGHFFSFRISGEYSLTLSITSVILLSSTSLTFLFRILRYCLIVSFHSNLDSVI